jgi:hypothetical protein
MTEVIRRAGDKIASYQVRERIFALFCVTVIAVVAMYKLSDPENIIINIVLVIGAFAAGRSDGLRQADATVRDAKNVLKEEQK